MHADLPARVSKNGPNHSCLKISPFGCKSHRLSTTGQHHGQNCFTDGLMSMCLCTPLSDSSPAQGDLFHSGKKCSLLISLILCRTQQALMRRSLCQTLTGTFEMSTSISYPYPCQALTGVEVLLPLIECTVVGESLQPLPVTNSYIVLPTKFHNCEWSGGPHAEVHYASFEKNIISHAHTCR